MGVFSKLKHKSHVKLFHMVHSSRSLRKSIGRFIPPPKVENYESSEALTRAIDKIKRFASVYPVNMLLWKEKIHLWPIFRFYLTLLGSRYAAGNLKSGKVFRPLPSTAWRRYMSEEEQIKTTAEYEPEEKYDFLVFSALRSISWIEQDKQINDRLLDPVIERLEEYGSVKKITMVNGSGRLDRNFAIPPEYLLFPAQYLANNNINVEDYENFSKSLHGYFSEYKLFQGDLDFFLDMFFLQYNSYRDLLQKLSPKAVFFFPADYNVALILAAKSLGIKAVDIQHGNMIGFYVQYNNWQEEPKVGYDLLPDAIFVWSEREKEHIKETWRNVEPVVFGYPWLGREDTKEYNFGSLQNFCNRHKYIVAISLSYHKVIPEIIEDIANDPRCEEKGVGFIVKRNLKRFNTAIPRHKHIFASSSVDRASFSSLMPHSHLHLTEESACLYEADQAGVNTLLFGDNWNRHFANLVDTGRVDTIESVDDFFNKFDALVSACSWPRLINNLSSEFDDFMRREFGPQKAREEIPAEQIQTQDQNA